MIITERRIRAPTHPPSLFLFHSSDLLLLRFLAETRSRLQTEKTVCCMMNREKAFRCWNAIFNSLAWSTMSRSYHGSGHHVWRGKRPGRWYGRFFWSGRFFSPLGGSLLRFWGLLPLCLTFATFLRLSLYLCHTVSLPAELASPTSAIIAS